MAASGIIDRYREYLPVSDKTPVISLHEGDTPLIRGEHSAEYLSSNIEIFFKYEGLNPTGSFKDRGMTMAISKAVEEGSKAVMCASTGNTSASAAAYSARAGLECIVLLPKGAIAMGKLAQALVHGANVIAVEGNFDDALRIVREITDKYPITLVNSLNPYRIEGQKSAAFEICDEFNGEVPDYHAIPVGNAGNITAYWKGFKEYHKNNKIKKLPKMIGFQAAGSAPIVENRVIEDPQTIATAIKIGNPASWQQAVDAMNESSGLIDKVTDDEILEAYKILASREGIFVEPASAASLAGVIKKDKSGYFGDKKVRITCTVTGHGLKDPDTALKSVSDPVVVKADSSEVLKVIGL
ncbi:MAG: threonine synthase [Candidatus Ancaeobacter aquaticus]|nr:threonine synthase [Candidatus Ancaeobacter aquaticus]